MTNTCRICGQEVREGYGVERVKVDETDHLNPVEKTELGTYNPYEMVFHTHCLDGLLNP